MGSATRHALAAVKTQVDGLHSGSLESAEQFFDAADAISGSAPLRAAFVDAGAAAESKQTVVERVFGSRIDDQAKHLLRSAVAQKWSTEKEFSLGLQEIAVRAVAQATGQQQQIGGELIALVEAIGENHELELTLGSKLTDARGKTQLIDRIFGGRVAPATLTIVRHLIANPQGRRIRKLLTWAAGVVADQAGRSVATVTAAKPLSGDQVARLEAGLSRRFGRAVSVNTVIDPKLVGGLRVQLGDDVIDDSAAARLHNLRLHLA